MLLPTQRGELKLPKDDSCLGDFFGTVFEKHKNIIIITSLTKSTEKSWWENNKDWRYNFEMRAIWVLKFKNTSGYVV